MTSAPKPSRFDTTTNTTSAGPAAAVNKCNILSIPAELRLVIYEHYFKDFEPDSNHETIPRKATLQPPLLHACSTFETEALPIYETNLETRRAELAHEFEVFRARMIAWRNSEGPKCDLRRAFAVADARACMRSTRSRREARDLLFAIELRKIGWVHVMEEIRNVASPVSDQQDEQIVRSGM